jgi:DNA repair exonuclease SbcCD ATPase subunit
MKRAKPPPTSAAPEQLSATETRKLDKLGQRDGHHALPKQDETGSWISPLLQDEVNAYDAFCVFAWGELQEKHEQTHREISRLCQEIHRTEERLTAQRKAAPLPPDLSARLHGEENLSEQIIRNRRQREYEQQNAGYFSKLHQTETALDQARRQLSELHSAVQSAEKTTSMLCERAAGQATKRIIVYWQGALRTHPMYAAIPPVPEVVMQSNAEADYYNLLDNSGRTTNIRKKEEHHVATQKQKRK